MKTLTRIFVLSIASSVLALSGGCATAMIKYGKDDIRFVRGVLRKGDKNFTVRAVQVPGVVAAGPELDLPMLARIADPGGNTVAFDLTGFSADGKELDPKAVETVLAYAQRCKDQHMAPLVRVLGAVEDPAARRHAVVTAAKAFRGEGRAVYWIDGPDAGALAKLFKKTARNLTVAAPENGDMATVDAPPDPGPAKQALLVGQTPPVGRGDVHFVVPQSDGAYAAIDNALRDPSELEPWTPDNSAVSEAERAEGFIALFDGKTTNGWFSREPGKTSFEARDGCLEWVRGGSGAFMTHDRYDNFILRFDWKIKQGGNSGVWVRAPRGGRSSKIGFEFQIMGDSDIAEPTDTSTGSIYEVVPPKAKAAKPEGEWNSVELVLDGQHYKATLNGVVVQDMNLDEDPVMKTRLHKGFICVTDHGNWVAYRNIRLKKL